MTTYDNMKRPNLFFLIIASVSIVISVILSVYYEFMAFPMIPLIVLHFTFYFRITNGKRMAFSSIQILLCIVCMVIYFDDYLEGLGSALSLVLPLAFYIVCFSKCLQSSKTMQSRRMEKTLKKLSNLKDCLDKGAITEEEYNMMKKETMATYERTEK